MSLQPQIWAVFFFFFWGFFGGGVGLCIYSIFNIVNSCAAYHFDSCLIICMCRLIAKYRPTMPVLSVVIPRLKTNQLKWSFTGAFEVSVDSDLSSDLFL